MNRKNILLVDDSMLTARVVSDFLIENGYQTEIVATGEASVEKACCSHFDLIIMDIELAGSMNGIEAACKILNCMDIPIVFFTAHSSKAIFHKIKEVQAYGFFLKGMDKYALLSTIEMALNLYEANAQTKKMNVELKKAQEELEASRKQYLELTENAPVGIIKCDYHGNIIFINKKALEIIGSPSPEETKELNLLTYPTLVKYGLSSQLKKSLDSNTHRIFEMNYESIWGKNVYVRLHMKPLSDGTHVNGAQLTIDDISEKKQLEEELRILSLTDPLTNVYNRRYFIQKLRETLDRTQKQGNTPFCIAMLDVDHFKQINDCFGHSAGDLVLQKLAETIKNRIRTNDCFARWGGEEFILLLPDTNIQQALYMIEALRRRICHMESPVDHPITASFGVVEYFDGDSVDSIVQRADRFMYCAKESGRNCVQF